MDSGIDVNNFKIYLSPFKKSKNPVDTYVIILKIMHGDADQYEDVTYPCKNEKDFIYRMKLLENMPLPTGMGGTLYEEWVEKYFEGVIPYDVTCNGITAAIDEFSGIYYDSYGNQYNAKVIDA